MQYRWPCCGPGPSLATLDPLPAPRTSQSESCTQGEAAHGVHVNCTTKAPLADESKLESKD